MNFAGRSISSRIHGRNLDSLSFAIKPSRPIEFRRLGFDGVSLNRLWS